jgi:energy-coupling factor transporter transmembrane protein EcfT
MGKELLSDSDSRQGICLDPRTKMVMVLTVTTIMLSSGNTGYMMWVRIALALLPFLLFLNTGRRKRAFVYFMVFLAAFCAEKFLFQQEVFGIYFLLVAVSGFLVRFMPGILMGYFLLTTTTVSEFMAAMERLRITEKISIPMSVMFRFFPTVAEEYANINDAMRLRGILLGGRHPGKILEYRLVPLLVSCVKIGEELSAAALTRGFGGPVKRTNICRIGFRIQDILLLMACTAAILVFLVYKLNL